MEKQRYVVLDKNGKANIVQKADSRFVGIDEMAQHIAFDIIEDYKSIIDGDKKIEETNLQWFCIIQMMFLEKTMKRLVHTMHTAILWN